MVGLFTVIALRVVYSDFSSHVTWSGLYNESLLHLAPRNVPSSLRLVQKGPVPGPLPLQRAVHEVSREPYIPPEAIVIITPKDKTKTLDEVVNVSIRNTWGFTRQPGLDASLLPLGIGLDFKWFYVYKIGTEIGARANINNTGRVDSIVPTLGLSYRLDRYHVLSNTELKLSYSPIGTIPVGIGFRINFGGR